MKIETLKIRPASQKEAIAHLRAKIDMHTVELENSSNKIRACKILYELCINARYLAGILEYEKDNTNLNIAYLREKIGILDEKLKSYNRRYTKKCEDELQLAKKYIRL